MQCKEWDDANSELFKESHDEAVHKNSYKSRLYDLISASLAQGHMPLCRAAAGPFGNTDQPTSSLNGFYSYRRRSRPPQPSAAKPLSNFRTLGARAPSSFGPKGRQTSRRRRVPQNSIPLLARMPFWKACFTRVISVTVSARSMSSFGA